MCQGAPVLDRPARRRRDSRSAAPAQRRHRSRRAGRPRRRSSDWICAMSAHRLCRWAHRASLRGSVGRTRVVCALLTNVDAAVSGRPSDSTEMVFSSDDAADMTVHSTRATRCGRAQARVRETQSGNDALATSKETPGRNGPTSIASTERSWRPAFSEGQMIDLNVHCTGPRQTG